MMRGIYGDDERYKQTYWSRFPHKYLAGDGCNRDVDGDYWFMGRIDDVMNISGHRISTTEVENRARRPQGRRRSGRRRQERRHHGSGDRGVRDPQVACQRIAGTGRRSAQARRRTLLGKFVHPKYVTFTQELPKTRSGKIMRRLLRDIAEGRMLGDTTTLADSTVVAELQQRAVAEAHKED